jgi:hypothetical protein
VKAFDGLDEFVAATGRQLGPTDWLSVEQDRVNSSCSGWRSSRMRSSWSRWGWCCAPRFARATQEAIQINF